MNGWITDTDRDNAGGWITDTDRDNAENAAVYSHRLLSCSFLGTMRPEREEDSHLTPAGDYGSAHTALYHTANVWRQFHVCNMLHTQRQTEWHAGSVGSKGDSRQTHSVNSLDRSQTSSAAFCSVKVRGL
jgi:hypothetical protein